MIQLVTLHRFFDAFGIFFVVELGGVDAEDDDFVGILLLQPDQVGEEMQAINSTQGPKFEDDDLAAQILEFDGLVGADSADGAVEVRRLDAIRRLRVQWDGWQAEEEQTEDQRRHEAAEVTVQVAGREEMAEHERSPLRAKDNRLGVFHCSLNAPSRSFCADSGGCRE
jgi:hypothetical protein